MTTAINNSLGTFTADGGLISQTSAGIYSVITSNASASAGTNYFLKDLGSGVFVSTALPTGISFPTITVTSTTQQAASNNRYSINSQAGVCTITLPASPTVGDTVEIVGAGESSTFNFIVDTNATQTFSLTDGIPSSQGASLTSAQPGCCIRLYAASAGATANWATSSMYGSFLG